jgi:hypothetical protein
MLSLLLMICSKLAVDDLLLLLGEPLRRNEHRRVAERIHSKDFFCHVVLREYIIRALFIVGRRRGCRTLRF